MNEREQFVARAEALLEWAKGIAAMNASARHVGGVLSSTCTQLEVPAVASPMSTSADDDEQLVRIMEFIVEEIKRGGGIRIETHTCDEVKRMIDLILADERPD